MLEYCVQVRLGPDAGSDLGSTRERVLAEIADWVRDGIARRGAISPSEGADPDTPLQKNEFSSDTAIVGDERLDTIVWTRPHERDTGLRWRTTIQAATLPPDEIWIDLIVELTSTAFVARQLPYTRVRPPKIISTILHGHRAFGEEAGSLLRPVAIEEGDVVTRLLPTLESVDRTYPLIVVSPTAGSNSSYPIAAESIQDDARGLGRVYQLSIPATFKLTEAVGSVRSCFDGGVRIYWPGFKRTSNPFSHRLFLGEDVEAFPQKTRERIFRTVLENAIVRHAEPPKLAALKFRIAADRERRRTAALDALEAKLKESAVAADRVEREFTGLLSDQLRKSAELSDFVSRLRKDNDNLRALVKEVAAELDSLKTENSNLKKTLRELDQLYVAQGKKEKAPESVFEAATRAQLSCGNLLILPGALDLARKSDYSDPEKVYIVLQTADEVAGRMASGATFGRHWGEEIVILAGNKGGFSLDFRAHLSMAAKGSKFKHEYEVSYLVGGRLVKRLIEPHILLQRKGNVQEAARIFLEWDPDERKLVVSRIGEHPKNLSS